MDRCARCSMFSWKFSDTCFWKLSNKYIQLVIFITESSLPVGSFSRLSPTDWNFWNDPCIYPIDPIDLILTILLPNAKMIFHLTFVALWSNLNSNNINSQHYLYVIIFWRLWRTSFLRNQPLQKQQQRDYSKKSFVNIYKISKPKMQQFIWDILIDWFFLWLNNLLLFI